MIKALCLLVILLFSACSKPQAASSDSAEMTEQPADENSFLEANIETQQEIAKEPIVYREIKRKENCFIVISKLSTNLRVFEVCGTDTLLTVQYPACLSKNKGNKEKNGDMKTPESPKEAPFSISAIQDASGWTHDFGDGRGQILSYGHWFLRLVTPGHSGIGIHGSTNNEESVPGRASEGCIRLRDQDIDDLKMKYAFIGMKVIIKAEEEGLLSFEKN